MEKFQQPQNHGNNVLQKSDCKESKKRLQRIPVFPIPFGIQTILTGSFVGLDITAKHVNIS